MAERMVRSRMRLSVHCVIAYVTAMTARAMRRKGMVALATAVSGSGVTRLKAMCQRRVNATLSAEKAVTMAMRLVQQLAPWDVTAPSPLIYIGGSTFVVAEAVPYFAKRR